MINRHNDRPRRLIRWMLSLAAVTVTLLGSLSWQTRVARAHDPILHSSEVFDLVGFDQHLDGEVPLDLIFRNEESQSVSLAAYLDEKPVVLALTYFNCETLCPLVRSGLLESLRPLGFTVGKEFDVLLVSIDPDETPTVAATAKAETVEHYGRPGSEAGWHFLTGDHETIDQLAEAVGFRYAYDEQQDEYAHPSGLVLLTPTGRIARYFYGIEYATQDLRLGLVDASKNEIGSPIDQLLLLCYHYDPAVGKYNLLIMNIVRLAGILTVGGLGVVIFSMWRRESERAQTHG